ncbi:MULTISPECIES: hypothetical protein [Pseudomonas]|uniref:Uncharacterized protein n=1 Tax=Pseudomonas reactans TaxID=117680 RepID=A0A7Y8KGK2_9PSED|nr:hypothetical protein [Pseudomonas reactans]NWE87954.1 hypothetical protein [Pseudomonas reactans]
MRDNDIEIVKSNIKNPHQLGDAVDSVYLQIVRPAFNCNIGQFVNQLCAAPYRYYWRDIDRRWKETKALEEARDNLAEALIAYDRAAAALSERVK